MFGADTLNDTGVVTCYDIAGSGIPCTRADAGDDGRYGRDAAASHGVLKKVGTGPAGFDFTKLANDGRELPSTVLSPGNAPGDWACTRDNTTGLVWETKTYGGNDVRSRRHKYTWYNTNPTENGGNAGSPRIQHYSSCEGTLSQCNTEAYVARVNSMRLCGFQDWRLPAPSELHGIVNYSLGLSGQFNPGWFTPADPQMPEPHYWTSATWAGDAADGWLVEIEGSADGGGGGHHHPKSDEFHVLLVRGGTPPVAADCRAGVPLANTIPSMPGADFVDNGNGTVTHLRTGLMWKRCAEGLTGASCAGFDGQGFTWVQALEAARLPFAGFSDWRVPNVKELRSIVETCGHHMAVNRDLFPNTPFMAGGPVFWTSTVDPTNAGNAYLVAFEYGGAVPVSKSGKLYLRLVRGGEGLTAFDIQNPRIPGGRRRSVRH